MFILNQFLQGLIIGLALILALGPQNIFVIEQGLKRNNVLLVCSICAISDVLLIFLGILIFSKFQEYYNYKFELLLNLILLIFILNFSFRKIRDINKKEIISEKNQLSYSNTIFNTLCFTFLNPHVYSDTIFILGNFSKNLIFLEKINFGLGASIVSIIFFFSLGYGSNFISKKIKLIRFNFYINIFSLICMIIILLFLTKDFINKFSYIYIAN